MGSDKTLPDHRAGDKGTPSIEEDSRLPQPACLYGYSMDQLAELLGDRTDEFLDYMLGKTYIHCHGADACANPHAPVYYRHDVLWYFEHRIWRTALPPGLLAELVFDARSDGVIDAQEIAESIKNRMR